MELRDLRTFVAVARAGSFTEAAAELGYTQSAVSQQIAALERELGQRLLERRPVHLTPAGRRLVEHATRVLLRVDVARTELTRRDGSERPLRIDACPLAAPALLARALRAVRRSRPGLAVLVRSTDARSALDHLASGTADLALVDGLTAPDSTLALAEAGLFSPVALAHERLALVLPIDHPLATRPWLDLSTLIDAPWVAAPRLAGGPPLPELRGTVTYEGTDVATLLELVAAGHGIALLPESVARLLGRVAAVRLRRPELVHRTEVLTPREPDDAVSDLLGALRRGASLT